MPRNITDPCERIIARALTEADIPFLHQSEVKTQPLDFYLLGEGVYIEVKQFHSPRSLAQLESQANIILIQGRNAALAFEQMLRRTKP